MTNDFDIAIIGGGPAGTSVAITAARQGASVVLFEAKSFPRHRVCGEFVSAESLQLLAELLRQIPEANAAFERAPVINRARLLLGERTIEAALQSPALSIPRYSLDALLWEAAQQAGVEAYDNCEVSSVEGERSFKVLASRSDYSARSLVIAAGRWSQFTPDRTLPTGPKWIGLKAHYHEASPPPSTDLYFFDGGYCGVQPVSKDAVNACAMVRSDRATTLQEVFSLHPMLAQRSASWSWLMQPISTAPLVYRHPQPVLGNMIFVGDAAAFIDPFAGDGISIALRSGAAAAQSICEFLQGHTSLEGAVAGYRREYLEQFAPLISAAARVRSLLALPSLVRFAAFEFLRVPGLLSYVIRRTRNAR